MIRVRDVELHGFLHYTDDDGERHENVVDQLLRRVAQLEAAVADADARMKADGSDAARERQ